MRYFKRKTLSISLGLILSLSVYGQAADAGTSAASFLQLGAGARYLAMGEGATAIAQDSTAMYWNVARLAQVEGRSFSFMHGVHVESTNHQYAAYAHPTRKWGTVGASFQTFSAGSLLQTDVNGRNIGNFSPRDTAVNAGWALPFFQHWALGMSAKYVHSKIINSDAALSSDGGLSYHRGRWLFGFSARNLVGGELTLDKEGASLPLTLQTGVGVRLRKGWQFSVDGIFPEDGEGAIALGNEFLIRSSPNTWLAWRAGYNSRSSDVPGLAGVTAGVGWTYHFVGIDYAWVPLGDLGQTHRISLSMGFF